MRTFVTVMLAATLSALCGCSSTEPGTGAPTPTPQPPETTEPETTEPQARKATPEPASKLQGIVSPNLAKGYAERDPISVARARATAPYPSQNVAVCGDNICAQGEFCCNESCGICAPVNGSCTQQVCGPEE